MAICPSCNEEIKKTHEKVLPMKTFCYIHVLACRCNNYYHKNCLKEHLKKNEKNCPTCQESFNNVFVFDGKFPLIERINNYLKRNKALTCCYPQYTTINFFNENNSLICNNIL